MSCTFSGHGVCSCPSKGCGVCLSTLVHTTRRCTSKQCVSKSRVWESLIAEHLVVSRESSCKRGVQASAYAPLRSQMHSLLCALRGNHPPGGGGHNVYWRCLCNCMCPLRLATMLDTMTCEVETWWKLQSCIISAMSVVNN
jgi:hypothetical protein